MRGDRSRAADAVLGGARGVCRRNRSRRRSPRCCNRSASRTSFARTASAGSAEETAAAVRSYIDAGAERFYLQILDLSDLDHLDFIADEVAPLLA